MPAVTTPTTSVAVAQVAPVVAEPEANRAVARRSIAQAVSVGAGVIVLPELMTTGYHLTPDEAVAVAETVDGPSLASWQAALAGSETVVVGGFCEAGDDGRIYNSAAVVSASGVLAVYRKTHMWANEATLFTPGDQPPPVVDTKWGPIGVAICYDLFFPELTRGLALAGARLLAIPTNSPSSEPRPAGDRPDLSGIGHAVARTTAYLNRVFVAVSDRHGHERGYDWTARSSIVGPEGQFLAAPVGYDDALLIAHCALEEADTKVWQGTHNDAIGDRRPDLYGAIVSPRC